MTADTSLLHDLPAHTVRRAVVSAMANNVYLITSKTTGAQILIDAADDLPAINALLQDAANDADVPALLAMIATTHQHWDHVRALSALCAQTGVATAMEPRWAPNARPYSSGVSAAGEPQPRLAFQPATCNLQPATCNLPRDKLEPCTSLLLNTK